MEQMFHTFTVFINLLKHYCVVIRCSERLFSRRIVVQKESLYFYLSFAPSHPIHLSSHSPFFPSSLSPFLLPFSTHLSCLPSLYSVSHPFPPLSLHPSLTLPSLLQSFLLIDHPSPCIPPLSLLHSPHFPPSQYHSIHSSHLRNILHSIPTFLLP